MLTLLIVLLMVLSPLSVLAQAELELQSYTSDDERFSLSYPVGWAASIPGDLPLPTVAFVNNDSGLARFEADEDMMPGDQTVAILLMPADLLTLMGVELVEDASIADVTAAVVQRFVVNDGNTTTGAEAGEVEEFDLSAAIEAGRVQIRDNSSESIVIVYELSDSLYAFLRIASFRGEYTAELSDLASMIATSIRYDGSIDDIMLPILTAIGEETTASAAQPPCPNPHGGQCLGPLEPGTYSTVSFTPALTYTVPEGWTNLEDLAGNVLLQRISDYVETDISTGPFVGIYRNVTVPDGCQERRDFAVGLAVSDLTAWFLANEQLSVTEPQTVSMGGLEGVYFDIAMLAGARGCSWELQAQYGPFVPFIIGGGPSSLYHVSLGPDWQERLYLLAYNTDQNVVIEVAPEGGSLLDYVAIVEPVLASFQFN